MNILILSVGTRNKIIQYFKRALSGKGRVIATDMSEYAPAVYEADKFYIVPGICDDNYIDTILNICKLEKIDAVLSLIDPELSLLAKKKEQFSEIGVKVIVSDYDLCELSLDKFEMYKWLTEHKYKCARSYMDKELFFSDVKKGIVSYPVIVKPARGSASISVTKASNRETVELLFSLEKNLMIQEFLNGQEIGADVYVDIISGKVVSVFTKKKIKMRAGETDKSVSFKDEKLFMLIERFISECGFIGLADIDLFDINGEYYISEVNPRFGGGYPHAYESGADHISMIINNLNGYVNSNKIGEYRDNCVMMKYNEVLIK